jgi:glycosyltransferase involved in cell wall biosynthesis
VLFDPLDVSDLARAIQTAIDSPERLKAAGRQRIAELSWDRTAAETLDAYRAAIE